MPHISLGVGLIIIAVFAQWLIKQRLKHAKLTRWYFWIAWIAALLGGAATFSTVGHVSGGAAVFCAVVSIVGLMMIIADAADKRPDWGGFAILIVLPLFMHLTSGPLGQLLNAVLSLPSNVAGGVGGFVGA